MNSSLLGRLSVYKSLEVLWVFSLFPTVWLPPLWQQQKETYLSLIELIVCERVGIWERWMCYTAHVTKRNVFSTILTCWSVGIERHHSFPCIGLLSNVKLQKPCWTLYWPLEWPVPPPSPSSSKFLYVCETETCFYRTPRAERWRKMKTESKGRETNNKKPLKVEPSTRKGERMQCVTKMNCCCHSRADENASPTGVLLFLQFYD